MARVVVLGTLALAHYLVTHLHLGPAAAFRVHQGLLGWDAGFYQSIALHGYGARANESLRFFPLLPMAARALSTITRMSAGAALLVISNAGALAAGALLYRLALRETGDRRLAVRATWVLAVAPPAFVLVMGYSESLMLVFGLCAFLCLRARRWWWAALAGLLLGLTRPLGLLLVVPAALEAWRGWRHATSGDRAGRVAAVVAPAAGAGSYLAWVGSRFGDAFLPLKIQTEQSRHGAFADPVTTLFHNLDQLLHGHHVGSGLHVPWVVLLVVLLVVAFRRFPASYGTFGALTLAASVSSTNLDSLERYALSAFPFVLAGASLTASQRVERVVLCLLAAGLVGYSLLAFLSLLVP